MKKTKPGILGLQRVKWNFEKFLIGKDGLVKERWASTTKPESLKDAITRELKKEGPPAAGAPSAVAGAGAKVEAEKATS